MQKSSIVTLRQSMTACNHVIRKTFFQRKAQHQHSFGHTCLAVATLLLLPLCAVAEGTLHADDSVAGLGTDIDVAGVEAGMQLMVVVTPPLGEEQTIAIRTDARGATSAQLKGRDTEVAGVYTVHLEKNGQDLGLETTFEILPDKLSNTKSSIQLSHTELAPTGKDTVEALVIVRDEYGNPLPNRPLKLISSRSGDRISSLESETDESGAQHFSIATTEKGELYLRAIDLLSGTLIDAEAVLYAGLANTAVGGPQAATNRQLYSGTSTANFAADVLGRNLYGQVSGFGLVDHFEIDAPEELGVNEDASIRITAVDRSGNRVEDYTNTVYLSSTDPLAFLPVGGEIQFEPRNLGQKVLTLGLRFRTPDPKHILYAEDSKNPNVFGQVFIKVTGDGLAAGTKKIQITSPTAGSVLSTPEVTVKGVSEPFVNLIVTGGTEDVEGDTTIDGAFSITVQLDPEKTTHTLRVQDKDGFNRLDSGEFTITLDSTAPQVSDVNFTPESPMEETEVLLVVHTEQEDIAGVTVQIGEADPINLEPVKEKPGTYQRLLDAPAAGDYDTAIVVRDNAGNETTETVPFHVERTALPKVQNVKVTPDTNAVTLQWDPIVSEPVDAYRIYVGESPTEFDFNLDTTVATSAAQVAGLRPGVQYYFAVTALESDRESKEFDTVSTTVKGLHISVSPQNASLLIDWSKLVIDTTLSSFILEFGVQPDNLTEKRILNSELRSYTLRDLINDVTYYLKLTPVSVTGQLMDDFSSTAEGTPNGAGFTVTPGDEVPFNTALGAALTTPPPNLHSSAPQTPSTGLPLAVKWTLALAIAGGLLIHRNRKRKMHRTSAFLQAMHARYKQK